MNKEIKELMDQIVMEEFSKTNAIGHIEFAKLCMERFYEKLITKDDKIINTVCPKCEQETTLRFIRVAQIISDCHNESLGTKVYQCDKCKSEVLENEIKGSN